MRCAKCGHENPAEAKFCGRCATRLAPAEPSIQVGPSAYPPAAGEVSQGLKIGIILGTLLIPLLGIIMGVIYMKEPSPAKKQVGKLWLYVGIGVVAAYCICSVVSGTLSELSNY